MIAPSRGTLRAAAAMMRGVTEDGLACLVALYDPASGTLLQLHTFADPAELLGVTEKCRDRARRGGYEPLPSSAGADS